jgi:iron(III) transport system permease protein
MAAYLVVAIGLPVFTITLLSLVPIWLPDALFARLSLKNYQFLLSGSSGAYPALANSFIASVVAATVITGVALAILFVSRRTTIRGRGLLEGLAMFPISMPALVISFGLLWAFLTIRTGLYGTLGVMVIALSVALLPQGVRTMSGGVIQIQAELQEAARASGASAATTMRRIFLPLIRSSLVGAWLYVFIGSFTALGAVLLLQSANNQLFSTLLWSFWSSGNPGSAQSFAAGCVVLLLILIGAIAIMVLIQGRLDRTRPSSR